MNLKAETLKAVIGDRLLERGSQKSDVTGQKSEVARLH